MRDYQIARQRYPGEMLDQLIASEHLIRWKWDYDTYNSRAIFWITFHGGQK